MEYKAPHRDAGASFARCSFSILCEVLPLNRSLTLMIADLLIDLVLIERSVIIWFSPVQGLHTRLGVLQVCEVLVLQDWMLYIPSCSSHGQEADLHPLAMRVARLKVEHLTEGEVLRGAVSFFVSKSMASPSTSGVMVCI